MSNSNHTKKLKIESPSPEYCPSTPNYCPCSPKSPSSSPILSDFQKEELRKENERKFNFIDYIYPESPSNLLSFLIIQYLNAADISIMRLVCKKWKEAIPIQHFMKNWRFEYLRIEDKTEEKNQQRMDFAVENNSMYLLRYFYKKGLTNFSYFSGPLSKAIKNGNYEMVMYMISRRLHQDEDLQYAINTSILEKQYETFYFLFSLTKKIDPYPYDHSKYHFRIESECLDSAAMVGNLDIIMLLLNIGIKPGMQCLILAARNRHFKILEFGIKKNFPFNGATLANACFGGCFDCIQLLINNGARLTEAAMLFAVESEKWDVFKFLVDIGCPISKSINFDYCMKNHY